MILFRFIAGTTQAVADAVTELATEQEVDTADVEETDDEDDALSGVYNESNETQDYDNHRQLSARVSHYDNVQTQINIENLYLNLDHDTLPRNHVDEESFLFFNDNYVHLGKIIKLLTAKSKKENKTENSPMLLRLRSDL